MKSVDNVSPVTLAAVGMQTSQTATTLALRVVHPTKQEKITDIGLQRCIPIWSLVKHSRNQIRYVDHQFSVKWQHSDFKGCPPDSFLTRTYDGRGRVWLRKTSMLAAHEYKKSNFVRTLCVTPSSKKNINRLLPLLLTDRSLVVRESVRRTLQSLLQLH